MLSFTQLGPVLTGLHFFVRYKVNVHLSHDMSKSTKWVCAQRTQISLGIRPVWSESLLSTWRKLRSFIHVNPPWSSGRLPEMSPKILIKHTTFRKFEISLIWIKIFSIYSIHFWKTSLKWKENLPDALLKLITCMVLSYPLRLWSDWVDAQVDLTRADLSLHWAHTHSVGFVMSRLIFPIF